MKFWKFGLITAIMIGVMGIGGYLFGKDANVEKVQAENGVISSNNDQTSLGDLIVLNSLFDNGTGTGDVRDLAGLIAIDRIADGGSGEQTSLGDLIVLNSLFDNGTGTGDVRDLAGLIAVDRIVGDGGNGDQTSLGDLIVLNSLFDDGTNDTRDLAGLIAVDRIVD